MKCTRVFFVVCSMLLLAGCSSSVVKTQYYTLQVRDMPNGFDKKNTEREGIGVDRIVNDKATTKRIGIYPIKMPDYAKHDGIVSLSEANQISISRKHIWAGEFEREATRVLTANIRKLYNQSTVLHFPWSKTASPDVLVRVVVDDFVGVLGGDVRLAGQLELEGVPYVGESRFLDFNFDVKPSEDSLQLNKAKGSNQEAYKIYVSNYSKLLYKLSAFISNNLSDIRDQ